MENIQVSTVDVAPGKTVAGRIRHGYGCVCENHMDIPNGIRPGKCKPQQSRNRTQIRRSDGLRKQGHV